MRKLGIWLVLVSLVVVGIPTNAFGQLALPSPPPPTSAQLAWEQWQMMQAFEVQAAEWRTVQAANFADYMAPSGAPPTVTTANVTVPQVAAATGMSEASVVQVAVRAKQALQSTGNAEGLTGGAGTVGAGAVGLLVGMAMSKGAAWLSEQVFGETIYFDAAGHVTSNWWEAEYVYYGDGWLFNEQIDQEIEYLFPGYEIATPAEGYSWAPGAMLESITQPTSYLGSRSFNWPPHPEPADTLVWSTNANDLANIAAMIAMDPSDQPIVGRWSIVASPPRAMLNGWFDRYTGEYYYFGYGYIEWADGYSTLTDYPLIFFPSYSSGDLVHVNNALTYYDTRIAALLSSGVITETTGTAIVAEQVDLPYPSPAQVPSIAQLPSDSTSATPLADIVDGSSTPDTIPDPMQESLPDVDPGEEVWTGEVAPSISALIGALTTRVPFAYPAVLAGAFSGAG